MTTLVETSLEEFVHELDVGTQAEVALGLQTIVLDPVWGENFGPILRLDDSSGAWDLYPFSFGRHQAEIIAGRRGVRLPASYEALVDVRIPRPSGHRFHNHLTTDSTMI